MRYAVVINNAVVNVVDVDPAVAAACTAGGLEHVACGGDVRVGWEYRNAAFGTAVSFLTLPELRKRLRQQIRERKRQREAALLAVGAASVTPTAEAKQRLRELKDWSDDNPGLQVPIEDDDGRVRKVSRVAIIDALRALSVRQKSLLDAADSHETAIAALADQAAAIAYDVDSGWPA